MKAPVALLGARLPGMEIKQAKVRGVESSGMLCSAKDLGLSQDHSGLLVLPADARPGADVRRVLDLDDQLITLKLTPNRGDCLSLRGIAREVAILTATPLIVPAVTPAKAALPEKREILLQDTAACPRYCSRIIRAVTVVTRTPTSLVRGLERGVDFAATPEAIERATQLIFDICGGAAGPISEVAAALPQRNPVRLRSSRVSKIVGV